MNDLDGEPLKVRMTSFSLMGQISRGGGELVTQGKTCYGANIQTAFAWFLSGTPKAYEMLVPLLSEFAFTIRLKHFV